MCYLKLSTGEVRKIQNGDVFYDSWYHSRSCYYRTSDGKLCMNLCADETYNGAHEHCDAMISAAHLADGADFCITMTAARLENGKYVGVADRKSVEACIKHTLGEKHVYGCDVRPGMKLWMPKSVMPKSGSVALNCNRRYSLEETFIDDCCVQIKGAGGEKARAEQGPLPKFAGNLVVQEDGGPKLSFPIYTLNGHIVL